MVLLDYLKDLYGSLSSLTAVHVFVSFLVLVVALLFGSFTARRFNFIHGMIVAVCWLCLVAGVHAIFAYLAAEGTNEGLSNVVTIFEDYLSFCSVVPMTCAVRFMGMQAFGNLANNMKDILAIVGLFVIPFIIWLVSRLISGSVRNRRGY